MPVVTTARASTVDRTTVVRVAADLADRDGWHSLTVSDVAKELGRHPSSLYGHVPSLDALRQDIAVLAMGELAERVWRAVLGKVGPVALQAIAEEYRDYAERFPGRTASLSAADPGTPGYVEQAARMHEPVRVTFLSFGLDDEQAAVAHRVFGATIDGFVRTAPGQDITPAVDVFVAALATGAWPQP
ncbi:MAG: regulatory protein TetR [Frankiales bacterium]|nr:regulatory protein TetR [Frankiales bacterium]